MPVAGHAATNQLSGSVPFYGGDKTHFSSEAAVLEANFSE
jgi:hypothetical protein